MKRQPFTLLVAVLLFPSPLLAAKPVPPSPYIAIVYPYAEAVLKNARDTHGPQKTGLLLSALDRKTLAPLSDRPIANPDLDQNVLRLLYLLSELSGRPNYRAAADAELKWLLQHAAASTPPLPPWERGFAWNVLSDTPMPADPSPSPTRSWLLWDHCFELAPSESKQLVLSMRDALPQHPNSPRRMAAAIRAFAAAYRSTKDDAFLAATESALKQLESKPPSSSSHLLSTAIDCGGAATRLPAPLATRLQAMAASLDSAFCSLPHDLIKAGGFSTDHQLTPLWRHSPSAPSTAAIAMMCVSRYENTADARYRRLIHDAARAYANAQPPDDALPITFGHTISLHLAAWRSTSSEEYLNHARALADLAIKRFWSEGPLPRAAADNPHYDTSTGADTLAIALAELHLSILHITAVRPPPNTIDR